jgi:peptide/nickel transport system substrate-binding protein
MYCQYMIGKPLVWEIDKKLQEDGARPIISYGRGVTCWQPYVKGLTIMVNSVYNGWSYGRRVA